MDNSTKLKIEYEISQIDELVNKSQVLISLCKAKSPDFIEISAIGSILHSFYNGIESIFVLIAKEKKFKGFSKEQWHKDLLSFIFDEQKILSQDIKTVLIEYMGFRHFFRHSYGYTIQWEKCSHLFLNIAKNWDRIKTEIDKL